MRGRGGAPDGLNFKPTFHTWHPKSNPISCRAFLCSPCGGKIRPPFRHKFRTHAPSAMLSRTGAQHALRRPKFQSNPLQPHLRHAPWASLVRRPQLDSSQGALRRWCADGPAKYADQNNTWVDRHVPPVLVPYMKLARIDRPIGTWLLLWPSLWSIGLAAPCGGLPDLSMMALFGVGAFVMRGAGCTINDMWDRKFDRRVARTTQRPLAAGTVSMPAAVAFLGGQLTAGLCVLTQLNMYSIALGAASLVPVALYPAAKRVTGWPQAVLGVTFNWGAMLGWAAVHGSVYWPAVAPLYAGSALWTIVYDTIYAHQDKEDDAQLGLKSSALTLGEENSRSVLTALTLASGALWSGAGVALLGTPWAVGGAYFGGVAALTGHLLWQVRTADWSDRENLNNRFVSNMYAGALLMAGIVLGKLMATSPAAGEAEDDSDSAANS